MKKLIPLISGTIRVWDENFDIADLTIMKELQRKCYINEEYDFEVVGNLYFAYENQFMCFIEATKEEIKELRKSQIPLLILKVKDQLFYLKLREMKSRFNVSTSLVSYALFGSNIHLCNADKGVCKRLSPLDDPKGCKKVRNYAKRIEDLDFITLGYETIGCKRESLTVLLCDNYIH